MEEQKDQIKEIFNSGLSDFHVDPPESIWNSILTSRRRKRRVLYFRYAAAAAIILFFASLPIWLLKNTNDYNQDIARTNTSPQQKNGLSVSESIDSGLKNGADQNAVKNDVFSYDSRKLQQGLIENSSKLKAVIDASTSTDNNVISSDPVQVAQLEISEFVTSEHVILSENEDKTAISENVNRSYAKPILPLDDIFYESDLNIQSLQKQAVQLSLAFGSFTQGVETSRNLFLTTNKAQYSFDTFQSDMAFETSYYEEIERVETRAPLSLGLKISLDINRRLSFESGLIYSELTTLTKTVELNDVYTEYERTLHYLGIPIGLRYDIIQSKVLNLYLQQSVIVEKGISAVNQQFKYEKNVLVGSDQTNIVISGLQLSTLSALGVDVPVISNLSAFGEGGIQVFYLNRTQPFNIRSAKMLWPAFQTGIRLKI
ncbi:MAG: hypothetical protein CVT92_13435 [Bacteroidetes bacterium HGW-Bacteroidetes-1]|jgi:hypothetical protein|nr:MAG: hypothetical protein CVT92_13435 [Bacteroidetes bacterium HGW-Bacteroidetes-1]